MAATTGENLRVFKFLLTNLPNISEAKHEVRKLKLDTTSLNFSKLCVFAEQLLTPESNIHRKDRKKKKVLIQYWDDDGDKITINSNDELAFYLKEQVSKF